MASTGVNVLRWSALGAGLFYGVYHQSKLTAAAKLAAIDREYAHKQSLIDKAKAEYAKKNAPTDSKAEGNGIITDPNDSRFDIEALIKSVEAQKQ